MNRPILQCVRSLATAPAGARALSTKRFRQPQPELTKFPEGHGEQIWIFNHITTNQVVYSHTPVLRNNRALRQLPFNGKKTKPAKLRKDYWLPLALIQFDGGAGVVGQSVFQKLREFRRRHELSWGHQAGTFYSMGRKERGAALSDQRANSVADVAAVLAGAGAGNRIRAAAAAAATADSQSDTKSDTKSGAKSDAEKELLPATVFWANERDREMAVRWSANVVHVAGIPTLKAAPVAEETA